MGIMKVNIKNIVRWLTLRFSDNELETRFSEENFATNKTFFLSTLLLVTFFNMALLYSDS